MCVLNNVYFFTGFAADVAQGCISRKHSCSGPLVFQNIVRSLPGQQF